MASGKFLSILALAGLIATASHAQSSNADYGWVLDSSKRSVKNMPQQNEFLNNQYPYPSKPRTTWELGISGGASMIFGDVKSKFGYGGGISFRKSISHVFSVRLGWQGGIQKGEDDKLSNGSNIPNFNTVRPNPWFWYVNAGKKFKANYRTLSHQLYVDGIVSLNAISSYRGNPKVDYYVLGGYSINAFDVDVDSRASNGARYNFEAGQTLDGSYDANGLFTDDFARNTKRLKNNQLIHHGLDLGGGLAFRVSDRFNIGLEQKFTLPFGDELDGIAAGQSKDVLSNTQFRLNFNLGNSSKRVAPLYWLNPNNYVYNEVNAPKHMKMPPVVLPDADGDGVTDQFDMEPNTPAGAAVDSHGVSRDTDGDGVPDYKDKEPLTARDCFPVDADGVGKCPEPPCCTELRNAIAEMNSCKLSSLPSVQFKSGSLSLSATSTAVLNSVAQQMNANPSCNVRVTGYYKGSDKRSMQLGWDRVNTVIKYLVEKQGIAENRLVFTLSDGGDPNTVDMMGTTESGPNNIPAPFPNLQKSK